MITDKIWNLEIRRRVGIIINILETNEWKRVRSNGHVHSMDDEWWTKRIIEWTCLRKISVWRTVHDFHAVSYTHLDVYKRQTLMSQRKVKAICGNIFTPYAARMNKILSSKV